MMDEKIKQNVRNRLRRVEGQIAALSRMVEDDRYCVDVLVQISAAQGALGRIGQVILGRHIETCVKEAFEHGDQQARSEKVDELMDIFARYGGLQRGR